MNIVEIKSPHKVLSQDPIHPQIGKKFRVSEGRKSFVCVIENRYTIVSCVSFTKGISHTMNEILQHYDDPDTAMFWTVYKTKEAKEVKNLPTMVGAKALILIFGYLKAHYQQLKTFATLSPVPTFSKNFSSVPNDDSTIIDWLSLRKDPVARFHLRNGAKIHHICRNADNNKLRQLQSYGCMVNYTY
tara:strand:- start:3556 stop:4116 length:561 start_codon:yes stop_codon:yes gene_type:complete